MPVAHTFWQLPEEEKDLFLAIEKEGKIVAYPSGWVENRALLKPQPLREILGTNTIHKIEIGLESQIDSHVVEELYFNGKMLFGVNYMTSPLLNYRRGRLAEKRLTQYNLAAYWEALSQDQRALVGKNPEFVSWGKKVFRIFQRHTPEWHKYKTYRATRRAKEAFLRGEIELVEY
jgi:hypothetical protein